jgi:hypothetical protein
MRTILNFEGRLFVGSINLSGFESGIALAVMIHVPAKKANRIYAASLFGGANVLASRDFCFPSL